ncbi:hypothetical protein ACFY7C_36775 [Streptomyces sp. NPDC012769]|uniref:hypothetical protein n=1 Tax=Streptomyces sp. NPDC012769 TaxID=3364848 RepID=UPI0036AC2D4D
MIANVLLILGVLFLGIQYTHTVITTDAIVITTDAEEWDLYHAEAYEEYASEFDAIFNAIEYKRSKNNRSMVKSIHSKSYKFI